MPIVFVHGVANRWGPDLDRGRKNIEALFRTVSLPLTRSDPQAVKIFQPYWGDLGANPSAGGGFATLPSSRRYETFGKQFGGPWVFPEMLTRDLIQVINMQPDQPLLATARHASLACAVDLLWTCAVESVPTGDERTLEDMGKFIALALDYAERNPSPRWLAEIDNDLRVPLRLKQEVDEASINAAQEMFGGGDWLGYLTSGAAVVRDVVQSNLIDLPRRMASEAGLYFLRPWMAAFGARTIGDILVYTIPREEARGASPGRLCRRFLEMSG